METKYCKRCDSHKPLPDFNKGQFYCKACHKIMQKAWRDQNLEKARQINKDYYEKNKEAVLARTGAYQKADRERSRGYVNKYRKANLDKCRQSCLKSHKKHADKRKAYQIKHVSENRLHYNIRESCRRARLAGLEGFYTAEDVKTMLIKQEGKCVYCEVDITEKPTVDHIIPITREGSTNWPSNLQLLCKPCNSSKNDKTHEEYLEYLAKKAQVAA